MRLPLLLRQHEASLCGTPGLSSCPNNNAEETKTPAANVAAVPKPSNKHHRISEEEQREQRDVGESCMQERHRLGNRHLRDLRAAAGSKRKLRMSPFASGNFILNKMIS